MTIRLLSPDLVRNRADDVSDLATRGFWWLAVLAVALWMGDSPSLAAALGAMAGSCAGVSIGAQLVARRVR